MQRNHRISLALCCTAINFCVGVLPLAQAAPVTKGLVGVGTWATKAEFKDFKVTKGGKMLWSSGFSKGLAGWKTTGGPWKVVNGALQQTGTATEVGNKKVHVKALTGNPTWSDYTLTLKARKLSGKEGFFIIVDSPGNDTKTCWNLGGWNNTKYALQMPGVTDEGVKGKIETGRWYDIRVETKGNNIKCFLNGKKIHDVTR